MKRFLLYGANGYTGRLTAELAVQRGMQPVLAGRSEARVREVAEPLGLEHRAFSLDAPDEVDRGLAEIDAVLHMAGPFSRTSAPMVDACLRTRTHYLDITGEIDVFEAIFARNDEAKRAGVALVPGVGFDVVPTDCLAVLLQRALPTATHLELAFLPRGGLSPGTTKTALDGLKKGGRERESGVLREVPFLAHKRWASFPSGERLCVSIPWGDVSTAFHSTGIPNVRVYMAMPPRRARWLRRATKLSPLASVSVIERALEKWIDVAVQGPDERARARGGSEVWGEAGDEEGRVVTGTLEAPEGYSLTADASLKAVARVLDGVPAGALTPSLAFGADFVRSLEGVRVKISL